MIQEDFADLHNHSCEALTAAWKLLWSIIIAMFHCFYLGSIWMRNLVEPKAMPVTEYGMIELQNEKILSDNASNWRPWEPSQENYA